MSLQCVDVERGDMMKMELQDIEKVAELPYRWDELNGKTIMISGGTGFIGSFISDVIRYRNKKYGSNIKIVSLSRRGAVSNQTVDYLKADITQPIQYEGRVDYILHLASNTHPKQYREDPIGTINTNVIGCNNLLKVAVEKGAKFLLASSVEIYGQGTEEPMSEKYCGNIDCNTYRAGYNEAKRTCEALAQSYKQQYGIEVVIARLARVFGADRKVDTKAMSQFIDKALAGEDIVLKSKGNQRFSYCYVADAVSGLLKLLFDGVNGEAYNVSDDDEGITLGGYAEFMAELAKRKVVYKIEDDAAASQASFALLDTTKLKDLDWNPLFTVSDGLKRTYQIKKSWKQISMFQHHGGTQIISRCDMKTQVTINYIFINQMMK